MPALNPIRVGVRCREVLGDGELYALAWILGRASSSLELTAPERAEVVIALSGAEPDSADVAIPSNDARSLDAAMEWLAAGDGAPLTFNLLGLVSHFLSGGDEGADALDHHGRFEFEASRLYQKGLLDAPFLDQLAARFLDKVFKAAKREAPSLPWYFCATLDLDSAGMFRNGGAVRSARRLFRERPTAVVPFIETAIKSLLNPNGDPYLSVRSLGEMMEGLGVPMTIFVQVVREVRLDSYDLRKSRSLIHQLEAVLENGVHEIGLHSSYATRDRGGDFFRSQFKRLQRILGGRAAIVHRAHYLRTMEQLDYVLPASEPLVDSSLGFGAREGFRRGTAFPFRIGPKLIELSPAAMDTQFRYFRKMTQEEAFDQVRGQMEAVAETGGALVTVHHPNEMDPVLSPGWDELFVDLAREARRLGARCQSLAPTGRELHSPVERLESSLREQFA